MSAAGWLQAAALIGLLMALDGVAAPAERLVYRALATDPDEGQD